MSSAKGELQEARDQVCLGHCWVPSPQTEPTLWWVLNKYLLIESHAFHASWGSPPLDTSNSLSLLLTELNSQALETTSIRSTQRSWAGSSSFPSSCVQPFLLPHSPHPP